MLDDASLTPIDAAPLDTVDVSSSAYVRRPLCLFGEKSLGSDKLAAALDIADVSYADTFVVREVVDDILASFHPFHYEAAKALLAFEDSLRFPALVFIAEVRALLSWQVLQRCRC